MKELNIIHPVSHEKLDKSHYPVKTWIVENPRRISPSAVMDANQYKTLKYLDFF